MNAELKTEILMNITPHETRVAVIENGLLQEIHLERLQKKGLLGNIYKGRVSRILPGMQAAFVDIGLERAGFLHISDVVPLQESREPASQDLFQDLHLQDWLKEGEDILVQVIKDPIGSKGARLSKHLSLASRYLVYMPDLPQVGVSMRIGREEERARLKGMLEKLLTQGQKGGFILRTAAEDAAEEMLAREADFLQKLWLSIQNGVKKIKQGIVYEDLPLSKKVIRDMVNPSVEKIRVDDQVVCQELQAFSKQFVGEALEKIEWVNSKMPIFERYGIEEELQRNLLRRVDLKSGGYLVIDQTEAMTTIDVNSGSFVGALSHEETIFKTNLEAAQMIARQLRLRNLGGIIVLDFIDMHEVDHRAQVLSLLKTAVAYDHSRIKIGEFTEFGLIELTRKRTHESLLRELCEPCSECNGRGMIKTPETLAYEIGRDLQREAQNFRPQEGFLVIASKDVVNWLMDEAPSLFSEWESLLQLSIKVKLEPQYTREQYDIVPL